MSRYALTAAVIIRVLLISWIGLPLLLIIDTAVCRPSWACHSAGNLREMTAMKWFAYVCA
jgi:hypothetical protein